MFKSLEALKGKFIAAACHYGDRMPNEEMQKRLRSLGWNFRSIDGRADEPPLNVIMHPDGKPIDGYGSPNYTFPWAPASVDELKAYNASSRQRWQDFAQACATVSAKAAPALQPRGLGM
jgi:hypothetical protein